MDEYTKKLSELAGDIDYAYQEGFIFSADNIQTMQSCIKTIQGILNDLQYVKRIADMQVR